MVQRRSRRGSAHGSHPGDAEALGQALQRGDAAAVRAVQDRVRRIVAFRGYGFSAEDRRDIVQEVMTQLWQAAQRQGGDFGGGFWGFVEVVTARRCIDGLRRRREQVELSAERTSDASPLSDVLQKEQSQLVRQAVASIDDPCQQLIRLRFEQHLSYADLSRILGVSEGALRVRLYRCVKSVASTLQLLRNRRTQGGERNV